METAAAVTPAPVPVRPGHSTGPRTSGGKAVSSQNARKHGCCSNVLILPNESEAEFLALRAAWFDQYAPKTDLETHLLEIVVEADWRLRRASRRYDDAEQSLYYEQPDPTLWTDQQHKRLALFLRYRTTEQRSFNSCLRNFDLYRKSRAQERRDDKRDAEWTQRFEFNKHKFSETIRLREARLEVSKARLAMKKPPQPQPVSQESGRLC